MCLNFVIVFNDNTNNDDDYDDITIEFCCNLIQVYNLRKKKRRGKGRERERGKEIILRFF